MQRLQYTIRWDPSPEVAKRNIVDALTNLFSYAAMGGVADTVPTPAPTEPCTDVVFVWWAPAGESLWDDSFLVGVVSVQSIRWPLDIPSSYDVVSSI